MTGRRRVAGFFAGLCLLAQILLSACSVSIGAPVATPAPNQPTNTPIEQVHVDITPVATPTVPPPSPTGGAAPAPGAMVKYTIKPGDTLSGIALQFGITVEDVVKTNNITDPNSIQAGQVLLIPTKGGATSTRSPTPPPTKVP